MERIKLTFHAKNRIKERKISKEEMEIAVSNPDSIKHIFNNKFIIRKSFNKKILEIVYTKEKDKILIITCYWL